MDKPKVQKLPWQDGPEASGVPAESPFSPSSDAVPAPSQPATQANPVAPVQSPTPAPQSDQPTVTVQTIIPGAPVPPSAVPSAVGETGRSSHGPAARRAIAIALSVCLAATIATVFVMKSATNAGGGETSSTAAVASSPKSSATSSSTGSASTSATSRPATPIANESEKGLFSNSSDDDDGNRGTGEMIPTWNDTVSYTCTKETYDNVTTASAKSYDGLDFAIAYPQVQNLASGQQDNVNALIKDKAMRWANLMYLEPDESVQSVIEGSAQDGKTYIASHVTSYITYNDEHLLSIAFVDHYFMGSIYGEYLDMRTLNVNLDTGETYVIGDITEPNEDLASRWLEYARSEEDGGGTFAKEVSLDKLTNILRNDDSISNRYFSNFFVDGNKNVEIGVTFHFKSDDGDRIAHGWAAEAFTPASLADVRKDSTFWSLIGA